MFTELTIMTKSLAIVCGTAAFVHRGVGAFQTFCMLGVTMLIIRIYACR